MKRMTKREIFSIPNLMSYFRILLIPVFCVMYVHAETAEDYFWAAAVVLLSSLTDLFDGMVARRFNMVTELGKVLDPVADKLTHAALAICIATKHRLMWVLIVLMLFKEGYMAVMGIYFLRRGRMLDGAMWFGKVCTAVLFVGMMALFLLPELSGVYANLIIVVMMAVMVMTLVMYIPVFEKMKRGEAK